MTKLSIRRGMNYSYRLKIWPSYFLKINMEKKSIISNAAGLVMAYGDLMQTGKYDPVPDVWQSIDDFITDMKCKLITDQNKHLIKLVMPYVPDEDEKLIFAHLRDQLGINWEASRGFEGIHRSKSKRTLEIICNNKNILEKFKKCEAGKEILASQLSSQNINVPVTFEYE